MAAYMKFDGIDGESQDKDHKNWIDVMSVQQGITKPGAGETGAARRRGDTILQDIYVTKLLDKSSPKLAEAVCKGKVFPKVEIHFTASITDKGRETYFAYELKNVSVSSYNLSGNAQDKPVESLSLNYEEIKGTYKEVDAKGSAKGNVEWSWKVEQGEK